MIVGTRGSMLATVQTEYIIKELSKITDEKIETHIIKTMGDKITTSQLYNMDSRGLFTKESDWGGFGLRSGFCCPQFKRCPYLTLTRIS